MNKAFKNIHVVCLVSRVMLSGCGFNNRDKLSASSDDSLKISHAKFPSSSFPPDANLPPFTPAPTLPKKGWVETADGAPDTGNLTLLGATGTIIHNVALGNTSITSGNSIAAIIGEGTVLFHSFRAAIGISFGL